jgi:eukaryotic-like serine/threonine-protein kinase
MILNPGSVFAHYEIESRIGVGGMGEVYSARDTKLGRHVALKLLTGDFTSDRDRLRRFEQEARATSALNHPNILTIYEIGKFNSSRYIAAELVDGMTLRQFIARGRPKLIETLDIAIQITAALSAAHANGIVHRDIKPENVMVRTDGLVKVLDFGLAKLTEPQKQTPVGPEASTVTNIHTDPGSVIGTIAYMSPEQLRVQDVDSRTDLWSLGVVLYEMIAGHPPFDQPTKSDLIVAILEREPASLTLYSADAAPEVQRLVRKTLRKNRTERYSSARDVSDDLKRIRNNLAVGIDNLPTLGLGVVNESPAAGFASRVVETDEQREQTRPISTAPPTSSADLILNTIKNHRSGVVLAMLVILAFVAGLIWLTNRGKPSPSEISFRKISSSSGLREAALSPDSKYVATVVGDAGKQSILVRQIATSSDVRVAPEIDERYRGLTFSRDGNYLYFLKHEADASDLFQVPTLGGNARKLISNVSTPISISPDGRQLAFVRKKKNEEPALMIANADGSGEAKVQATLSSAVFGTSPDLNNGPAWSPDGKTIACPISSVGEPFHMDIAAVTVSNGSVHIMNARPWYLIGQVAWLSDGSELLMNAELEPPPASTFQLWRLSNSNGEARRITNDAGFYRSVSLNEGSNTLLTTQRYRVSNIWMVSLDNVAQSEQLANSRDKATGGLTWTRAGRIVHASAETGNQDIWSMDEQGRNSTRLSFNDYTEADPVVSSDGRYIVYVGYKQGRGHIWRMNADGTDQRQITNGKAEDSPDISPDGKWIVYHCEESSTDHLCKIPIEGGPPTKLTTETSIQPNISPDGNWLAYFSTDDEENSPWRLTIISMNGKEPSKIFALPAQVCSQCFGPRWTPDSRAVGYIRTTSGVSNIWIQALDESSPKPATNFSDSQIYGFAWSPDGKKLACVRGTASRDLVLISNFR